MRLASCALAVADPITTSDPNAGIQIGQESDKCVPVEVEVAVPSDVVPIDGFEDGSFITDGVVSHNRVGYGGPCGGLVRELGTSPS